METKLSEAEQTVADLKLKVEALQAEQAQCNLCNRRKLSALPHDDTPQASLGAALGTTVRVHRPHTDVMAFDDAVPQPADPLPTDLTDPVNFPISLSDNLGPRHDCDAAASEHVVDDVAKSLALHRPLHPTLGEAMAGSARAMGSISTLSSHVAADLLTFAATTSETLPPAAAISDQLFHATACSCCSSSCNPQQHKVDALDTMGGLVRAPETSPPLAGYITLSLMEARFGASVDGESAMLCSEAYLLIAQQNLKGLSQEDVATWLWSGFRKSARPGWGCRVKTDTLFSLLTFISES